jgi:hypothetical protein
LCVFVNQSIELEDPQLVTPNTSAYRAAAVQIIAKGGSHDEALNLMRAARIHEKKLFALSTTQRTNEILDKVRRQQEHVLRERERERQIEQDRKLEARNAWRKILDNVHD